MSLLWVGCKPETQGGIDDHAQDSIPVMGDWVRIYHANDPDRLHPYNARNAYATFIKEHIYMYLYDYDAQTMEHVPTLAKGAPEISADQLSYTYEIRPEATWDNGSPITAKDFEFSIKAVKLPLTDDAHQRNYYSFIKDIKLDPTNDRKFTVICSELFFLAETAISGMEVISREFYDPEHLLDNISVEAISTKPDDVSKDPAAIKFADAFNADINNSDPAHIYGSGPYKLESWTPGDNVTLVRKDNWWGDKLRGKSWYFQGYVKKLIFKTITDRATVPAAAQNDELDVIRDMSPDDFKAAREDTAGYLYKNFNFHTPDSYSMMYLGFNCKPPAGRAPVLEEVAVRKALSHCADLDGIIANIYNGYGQRQNGPITPLHPEEYDSKLKPLEFSVDMANKILDEAGWKDNDGDGIREKVIRGRKVKLEIEVLISNSTDTGPRMVRMIADQALKAGIKLNTNALAFNIIQQKLREHDFDIAALGFSASPLATDLKQVWHTENWLNGGSNYFGFGNARTDSLIEKIRVTMDPAARTPLYHEFQRLWQEEVPVIVLMAPKEKILIHKRFRHASPTIIRPGFKPLEFWVPLAEQRFK
ncbi:MAG: ABC transporter substrate-binding protein [Bacteroidia bacterium]